MPAPSPLSAWLSKCCRTFPSAPAIGMRLEEMSLGLFHRQKAVQPDQAERKTDYPPGRVLPESFTRVKHLENPSKPAYLITHADRALIQAHPLVGANLLAEACPDAPEEVARTVAEHHERPGGRGLLAEVEPGALSLVVAAANLISSILEDRPYRPALSA